MEDLIDMFIFANVALAIGVVLLILIPVVAALKLIERIK
jgi:hypothetical protein